MKYTLEQICIKRVLEKREAAQKTKCAAFTLVEVLIVVGIVGIIAMLVLPNIIQEYKKRSTVSKLRNTVAELNQVIRMATADYEEPAGWVYGTTDDDIKYFVDTYIAPYVVNPEVLPCKSNWSKCYGLHTQAWIGANGFANYTNGVLLKKFGGSSYAWYFYRPGGWYDGSKIYRLRVYINNNEKINRLGTDVFTLQFDGNTGKFIFPGITQTRTDLLYNRGWGGHCIVNGSGSGYWSPGDKCGAVIVKDGWKIAPDYPWKK